jgi:hypothetical protein
MSYETAEHRMVDLLDSWTAAARRIQVHQVLHRAQDSGGYLVVETEDTTAMTEIRGILADFNFHIDLVRDGPRLPRPDLAPAWPRLAG